MRVLVHIHTFNDGSVISNLLEALRRQTCPADAIVIIDNASTDDTLDRDFPDHATIIRNSENTGSCGAVHIGLAYALEHRFDWTWVFDADSVPEPDALANLLAFYDGLAPEDQERVYYLASNMMSAPGVPQDQPMVFTESGVDFVPVEPAAPAVRIDFYKWSGALFRMPAVSKIGLPSADYFIDFGEIEYGYRAWKLGFRGYLVTNAAVHQDVGRLPGVVNRTACFGPFKFWWYESVAAALLLSREESHLLLGVRAPAPAAALGLPQHTQRVILLAEFCSAACQPSTSPCRMRSRLLGWPNNAYGASVLRLSMRHASPAAEALRARQRADRVLAVLSEIRPMNKIANVEATTPFQNPLTGVPLIESPFFEDTACGP